LYTCSNWKTNNLQQVNCQCNEVILWNVVSVLLYAGKSLKTGLFLKINYRLLKINFFSIIVMSQWRRSLQWCCNAECNICAVAATVKSAHIQCIVMFLLVSRTQSNSCHLATRQTALALALAAGHTRHLPCKWTSPLPTARRTWVSRAQRPVRNITGHFREKGRWRGSKNTGVDNAVGWMASCGVVHPTIDYRIYKYLDSSPPINQPYKILPLEIKLGRHL